MLMMALLAVKPAGVAVAAELCARWSQPQVVGQLDVSLFPEASGIGVTRDGERLYHHNDGNQPGFLVTDRAGALLRQVRVEGFAPLDVEDLSVGRCGSHTCLFLADIGDNAVRRSSVQVAVIEEVARIGERVSPRVVITARYPDGPHNAEAIALHPSGDLYLVTKSGSGAGQAGPARVYRLTAAQIAAGGEQLFESRGEIPVPALAGPGLERRRVVTAMDIAPDGGRVLLLTYDSAIEIAIDLSKELPAPAAWAEGRIHRVVPIAQLIQAEAIAYDRDGRSILYSTESVRGSAVPLIQQSCAD